MDNSHSADLPCEYFWTARQASSIDQDTIGNNPDIGLQLMEQAGQWIAITALARYQLSQSILILAGNGNNGGDALVAARLLQQKGLPVHVVTLTQDAAKLSAARRQQEEKLKSTGILPLCYLPGSLKAWQGKPLMIIDGLLGLGLKGPLKAGIYRQCLEEAAGLQANDTIAIDLPSGLCADEWEQEKAILPAKVTVTFGAAKPAHLLAPSMASCGEVIIREIAFAKPVIRHHLEHSQPSLAYLQPQGKLLHIWDSLSPLAHKFNRGHVLVIGGSPGKIGAPILSAAAAAACGAGWVSLALAGKESSIAPKVSAFMTFESFFEHGTLDASQLRDFIIQRKVQSLVIGPGCVSSPLNEAILEVLRDLMNERQLFVVIDAGALHGLIEKLQHSQLRLQAALCLATPHPGEWRKMGHKLSALNDISSVLEARNSLLEQYGISLIYKTATPISPQPAKSPYKLLASCQNHVGLARAGSGDILAGIAAVMGMRHIPAYLAGIAAHQWLVRAAERASLTKSVHGLAVEDLLIEIQSFSN